MFQGMWPQYMEEYQSAHVPKMVEDKKLSVK